MTAELCKQARKQWLAACRARTGDLCVIPQRWNEPRYVVDRHGYGVEFCE